MKLLGVVIANGFSPEARVFASLLAERSGRYDPLILHHDPTHPHAKDSGAPDDFARAGGARILRFDAGWRRNDDGRRSAPAKIGSWALLHAQLPRLLVAARRFGPDVVYSSQQRWDCYLAGILAHALGRPQVVHLHYNVGAWLGKGSLKALSSAAGVVCISEFIRAQAKRYGVPDQRLCVVPNTLTVPARPSDQERRDARRSLGLADDVVAFAFVARLAEGKGHADALEAFGQVTRDAPNSELLVVGDGPLRAPLEALANRLGIANRVRFLGFRRDVPTLLSASDAFVHPSIDEPFGLSILEASALGLPTVAYRDAGPAEIVLDGDTGLLSTRGDTSGLAAHMLRLIRDPEERKRMGERARADARTRFDPKQQGLRFADFLGALAGGPVEAARRAV